MISKSIQDLSVLLVESSHVQAKIILHELTEAGVQYVETRDNANAALEYILSFNPDLVISTMYLPDMTGAELVQAIREDDDMNGTAFILISSETSFEYLDPVRQAGVTAILPKPFEHTQLKRALVNTVNLLIPDKVELSESQVEDLRVLIVDDSSLARKFIIRVLNGLGIEYIVEADDGTTAIPLLETQFFDFVITDYNMPEMDGRELIEYIRTKSDQRTIPVIMVTSEGNRSSLAAIEQAGVSGIYDKPFDSDTVKDMIQNIMTDV